MKTVILIDDEPWALESLYHVFRWEENGFQVIGRYTDSGKGWTAIVNDTPEVVFIDIRMPVMSGLEVAAKAQCLRCPPLFIIVSGYDLFQYAQQALRLGVFDYCIKPVERATAQELLAKLSKALEDRIVSKSVALLEDIQNGMSGECLYQQSSATVKGNYWTVAILRYVDSESMQAVSRAVENLTYLKFQLGISKMMLVFNGDDTIGDQVGQALKKINGQPKLFIGLSRTSNHSDRLSRRVFEAQSCAYTDFVNPKIRLLVYHAQESEAVERCIQDLLHAIANKDGKAWAEKLNSFPQLLSGQQVQMHSICRMWNRLMDAFDRYGSDRISGELEWVMDAEAMRTFLKSTDEMTAYLDTLMQQLLEEGTAPSAANVNQSFLNLLEYVRGRYTERLHLSELASQFHLNMTYCSELFRKVVGMTYTDYVTKLRMEHARKALLSGECNLQKLALELGYGDYFTFSKRFKQYFGQAPTRMADIKGMANNRSFDKEN